MKTAKVELLDGNDEVILEKELRGEGDCFDFEFSLLKPIDNVRSIRVVSLSDQGGENPYSDVAIGEIEIE